MNSVIGLWSEPLLVLAPCRLVSAVSVLHKDPWRMNSETQVPLSSQTVFTLRTFHTYLNLHPEGRPTDACKGKFRFRESLISSTF